MRLSTVHRATLIGATCALLGLSAVAQTAGTGGSAAATSADSPVSLSSTDRDFIVKAAKGGMAEVELGKLAQQKATSVQVKNFGEHMIQDHSQANEKLKKLASTKGVGLPPDLDDKHKAVMQTLQKLSGGEFDREYMKQMVADHRETVADFRKQAESGKDTELKTFAASSLPKLEEHLRMAESTSQATKGSKS